MQKSHSLLPSSCKDFFQNVIWASPNEDPLPVFLRIMAILMGKLSRIFKSGSSKSRHPVCTFPHTPRSASPLPLPGKSLLALWNHIYIFNLMGWTGSSVLSSKLICLSLSVGLYLSPPPIISLSLSHLIKLLSSHCISYNYEEPYSSTFILNSIQSIDCINQRWYSNFAISYLGLFK